MGELSELPNIGEVIEKQLNAAGITTCAQLREAGSREAWLKIKSVDSSACIQRLQSLEGAVRGIRKSELPPEVKADLRKFYRMHK